jgi:uncharacterized protein (TIGR02996 family)
LRKQFTVNPSHQPFRREIAENPTWLEPRLVYADWLEEQGNPLGEFIRTQIALSEMSSTDPARSKLESRELQLRRQFQKGWVRSVRPTCDRWEFRNGMIEGISLSSERFLERAEALFDDNPIRHCQFSGTRKHLRDLTDSFCLPQLESIDLAGESLGRWGSFQTYESERKLIEFLRCDGLSNICHLGLAGNLLNDGVLDIISENQFPRLDSLDLTQNVSITTERLGTLLSQYPIRNLRVSYTQHQNLIGDWRPESTREFAQSIMLQSTLRELGIGQRSFRFDHVGPEFDAANTALERISLRGNPCFTGMIMESTGISGLEPQVSHTDAERAMRNARSLIGNAERVDVSACLLLSKVMPSFLETKGRKHLFNTATGACWHV